MPLPSDLDSLIRGQHGDPFRLLGAHVAPDGGVVVRALRPGARGVTLLLRHPDDARVPMTRLHPDGLFEARVDGLSSLDGGIDYRFEIESGDGAAIVVDDPYRFGRIISDYDLHLFGEGLLLGVHERLGAHPTSLGGVAGVHFAVWAPNGQRVSVIGDFNQWDGRAHPMRRLVPSGIWELFVPDLAEGERYKFEVRTTAGHLLHKIDPYGRFFEVPPQSAAIVFRTSGYPWGDEAWMRARAAGSAWLDRPMSTYEVHLASWKRVPEEGD